MRGGERGGGKKKGENGITNVGEVDSIKLDVCSKEERKPTRY